MSIERCSNAACQHRFDVVEFGHFRPAQPEPRRLVCPYCGHTIFRKTRGAFICSRLEGNELFPPLQDSRQSS